MYLINHKCFRNKELSENKEIQEIIKNSDIIIYMMNKNPNCSTYKDAKNCIFTYTKKNSSGYNFCKHMCGSTDLNLETPVLSLGRTKILYFDML